MDNKLIFNGNYETVEQFKANHNVSKISVFCNPKTNKRFFAAGNIRGAVGNNQIPVHPVISEVTSPDTGETFYLMHEEPTGLTAEAEF